MKEFVPCKKLHFFSYSSQKSFPYSSQLCRFKAFSVVSFVDRNMEFFSSVIRLETDSHYRYV